ncbi:PDZ domain-containing protein [Caenorhabditis elegans]|uniref:PDZ domain-containing protein n=1 Tax=Caenorhabditis elegans TaxID=6239 RepID=Q20398_CAEEL|nr:PDZ domain-containing protein [Caenorhabditis elegans]CAA92607.2 PDZ domain-containing protein [Caenorhabditis elegans]|eukprot:NP_501805.2 MAGUK family [Caenorhabditis elegans]
MVEVEAKPSSLSVEEDENENEEEKLEDVEKEKLVKQLKFEKAERRRIAEEMEKEIREVEAKWMEKVRKASEERDDIGKKIDEFEEKIDSLQIQVHRSETYKMEIEEANKRLRLQYEALQRDYEETMQERSIVLEENSRQNEERDRLQKEIEKMKEDSEEVAALKQKLENTRRLLKVNMEETAQANARKEAAIARLTEAEQNGARITEERDEALRKCQQTTGDAIVDIWNTHSVQINLPFNKPNLGIMLGGGRTDDGSIVHGPIYVRQIAHGSPFDNVLKKLDHIMMVNDISVTDMDERSVMGMLSNCHHIHLVIRRRSNCNKISDVCLPLNYGVGLELSNGVFINSCEPNGAASRSGLAPGQRVVHVMHTPVYDAKHAEMLIKNSREPLVIGILQSTKRGDHNGKDKHRQTIFSRWFSRNGGSDKERTVVAKANIDRSNDQVLLRQGSLRMPQASPASMSPLVRYGSLRAPTYSSSIDHTKLMLDALDKRFNAKSTAHSEISSSSTAAPTALWSPSSVNEKDLVFAGTNIEGVPVYVPKSTIFSTPTSPVTRLIRQNSEQKRTMSQISSHRGGWDGRSFSSNTTTSDARPYSMHFTPTSSTIMEGKPHRRSAVYSPSHPPVYPTIRDDSMSSVMSSSNSIRLPSTSFSNQYPNNSTCSLTGGSGVPPRHCISKDGSDFSISTTGSAMHSYAEGRSNKKYHLPRGNHHSESLLVNRSSQPRLVEVPRSDVKLCGGNAIGILAEKSIGSDLLEGDLILSIDGNCVRNTTLECAMNTLSADNSELTGLLVQDGGDRLNRLRLGADGDSFFLRVNIDRSMENKDELDLKCGDVVFVDKTMLMGKTGRWRAWKVDKEGRQREHGAIPSSTTVYQAIRANRYANPFPKKAYEWVEKLDTKVKRPVLLFGAVVEPFLQMLVDESDKFSIVARESLTASLDEVSALLKDKVLIDSKQNDDVYDLYHVVSTAHIMDITAQGLHCVLQVDQSAIDRLKRCRMFPILVKIRFKSVKQLKDVNEHICGEKISSKEAKQLIEKDLKIEKDLDGSVTLVVPSHNNVSFMMTHAVLQLKKIIEDEQKKIVWVQRKVDEE